MKNKFVWLLLLTLAACTPRWEDEEKEKFRQDCMRGATNSNFGNPEVYCDCMLNNLMKAYPNPDDIHELTPEQLATYAMDCADSAQRDAIVWQPAVEQAFKDSCLKMAAQTQKVNPDQYCDCVLDGVKKRFRTTNDLSQLNPQTMQAIGQTCQ
ncbi:hypothetical protein SAMN05421780_10733 [Flexibacter flexilis DSM 6793]|uniref:Lipoprotein n=1 Tax=Flexibacter flexilis DSM 6793 TaxID=927664 RepID=A0A1I1KFM7_9BACT|nr:hypothetical protein [Flexibacter flexilis]SFC59441.1 hypothetical protein SAMN05421780_10733 [Flexibacter flexilis DSM 6793]